MVQPKATAPRALLPHQSLAGEAKAPPTSHCSGGRHTAFLALIKQRLKP
jgi:hypothetical protein